METNPPNPSSRKKQPDDYLRYSAMAFQMFAIIGLGVYGGYKLDQALHFKKVPVFTIILSLLSAFVALWFFIKDVLKKR